MGCFFFNDFDCEEIAGEFDSADGNIFIGAGWILTILSCEEFETFSVILLLPLQVSLYNIVLVSISNK